MKHRAHFRFFEELNDFLPGDLRKISFLYRFDGSPAIKDSIEAIGVPHTEVDLVLVNGESVGFGYRLCDGDRVSVYPVFESFDISGVTRLRPKPLREPQFIPDVHLGTLARRLRLLGFDTYWRNDLGDDEIIRRSIDERRAILTRDLGILKHGDVTHGYYVRSKETGVQLAEVMRRFDLAGAVRPFTRCMVCNGDVVPVAKEDVLDLLEPMTRASYEEFRQCAGCGRVYWKGPHYRDMLRFLKGFTGNEWDADG